MSFRRRFISFAVLTALAAGSAQAAAANTVTFDGLPELLLPAGTPWIENGVTATGDPRLLLSSFAIPGTAHLDDSVTEVTSFMDFTMPRRFRPISLDILGLGTNFFPDYDTCTVDCVAVPYDNVAISGVRDGTTVFEHRFYAGDLGQVSTYVFPTGVNYRFDSLSVRSIPPTGLPPGPGDDACFGEPCGHFSIDNVTLAPVPLPASALLLLGALATVGGLLGSRRSRAHTSGLVR
jgi:hypothetical protein